MVAPQRGQRAASVPCAGQKGNGFHREVFPLAPWYLESAQYGDILEQLGIGEEEYSEAVDEVLEVFPLEWAGKEYGRIVGSGGPKHFSLRPSPFHGLAHHPLPALLIGAGRSIWPMVELVRLGNDLLATKSLLKIHSLRRDLRDSDQFLGRLFELEALAEFARHGLQPEILETPDCRLQIAGRRVYVEMRHRGLRRAWSFCPGSHRH